MSLSGERNKSPEEMKIISIIQHGPCGFDHGLAMSENDVAEYGIDWDEGRHNRNGNHNAAGDLFPNNPFVSYEPDTHPYVQVDESPNPMTEHEMALFLDGLSRLPLDLRSTKNMEKRRILFQEALFIACSVVDGV